MVVKMYTFVEKSANCDLTSIWAPLKAVAGQRLYTIQRRRPFSAEAQHACSTYLFKHLLQQLIRHM